MFAGSMADPTVRTARVSGAKGPSPKFRTRTSYAAREATLGGRIVASGELNRTCRNGVPSSSRSPSVGKKTSSGRRMTRRASFPQAPCAPGSRADLPDRQRVDPRSQDRQERGLQGERGRNRQTHDDRPGDPDGTQDHELEEDQAKESEQHRQAGEEDRPPGRRDRHADGRLHGLGVGPRLRGVRRASSSRKRLSISSE